MWKVSLRNRVIKQLRKLPEEIQRVSGLLIKEIELMGPYRRNWKHYGKLTGKGELFLCHIKDGKPTYLVCWEVTDKKAMQIEVYYVGTHENAPY